MDTDELIGALIVNAAYGKGKARRHVKWLHISVSLSQIWNCGLCAKKMGRTGNITIPFVKSNSYNCDRGFRFEPAKFAKTQWENEWLDSSVFNSFFLI